jgi:hypothetical protein
VIFLQITPRAPGQEAQLSAFLTGTEVFDGFAGKFRRLDDLGRRQSDLRGIVCSGDMTSLPRGIARVH